MTADAEMGERMAAVEAWKDGHDNRCAERYKDIKDSTTAILATISSLSADMKAAVTRLHERNDGQDKQIAGQGTKIAGIASAIKNWALSGIVAVLLAVVGYLLVNGTPWQARASAPAAHERGE